MYDDWTPYPYTTTTSGTEPLWVTPKPQDISEVKESLSVKIGTVRDKVDALSDWANDLDDAVSDVEKDVAKLRAHKTKTVHRLGALELDVYYLERRIGIMESDARLKAQRERREADQRRKRVGAVVACVVVSVLTFAAGYGAMALVDWLHKPDTPAQTSAVELIDPSIVTAGPGLSTVPAVNKTDEETLSIRVEGPDGH